MPPAYLPGFTMPDPLPQCPGSSQPTPPITDFPGISMDDPIVRAAYGMLGTQESQTVAFGPGVQQSSEIEEVPAADTPLAVRIRGLRAKRAREPFTPSDF